MRSLSVTLVKGHFYKMEVKTDKKKGWKVRLALSYGVECWTMNKRERGKELVVKVYMLRWMCEL